MQDVTIQLAFLLFFIVCRIFLSSFTLFNTSSFLMQSFQLIFTTLLQHHVSKVSRYWWLLSEVSRLQHHTVLYSKCSTSLVSSLNWSGWTTTTLLTYVHTWKSIKTPLKITFIYLCNEEIYCIISVSFSTRCHSCYYFIVFYIQIIFISFINHAQKCKYQPNHVKVRTSVTDSLVE